MPSPRRLPYLLLGCLVISTASGAESSPPDFNREVRPILSRYCFKCHGPDDKSREGELRLDVPAAALGKGESGLIAIVPGKPEESEVVARICSSDRDEVMPPPSAKLELRGEEKEVLKRWIAAGANYQPHWAFTKPKAGTPPGDEANPIDAFIRARLTRDGFAPSPEADRRTLIRRVSFDLIGLPPTAEEAAAFVNDTTPDAYERVIDRLLASPHYGERWARRWLDLARYADSNGYEKDRTRSIWPYRDWVVDALNADLPFDQFTIEQIAGDLLPQATQAQIIATGFHRNTMLNEEGGIDPLEFRYHAMADRVATTGATWLGLTTGCAQCHTHKFDPITHREYFGLMAFLNNADEPDLELPPPDAEQQVQRRNAQIAKLLAELPGKWPLPADTATSTPPNEQDGVASDPTKRREQLIDAAFAAWLEKERDRTVHWTPLVPVAAKSNSPLLTIQDDHSILASGDITKVDTYEVKYARLPKGVTAIRLEALADVRLPGRGPGLTYYEGPKGDFFLGEFSVSIGGAAVRFARASESYASNSMGTTNPVSAKLAIDGDPQTGWSCAERMGLNQEAVFVTSAPIAADGEMVVTMQFGRHYACSLGRFRLSATTDPRGAEALDLGNEATQFLAIPDAELSANQRAALREAFLLRAPELAEASRQIRELRQPLTWQTTLVFRERPPENPRPTFLHRRGEFTQPEDRIEPTVLAVLNPLPADAPPNRLTLARWLVSAENPLAARVAVNRAWAAFFAKGLVKTTEDFGYQGEPPSHPDLLDWLATEFIRDGWSMKKMHRRIVTSATYRQSSKARPEVRTKDPENRLLAYYPRIRLEAEMIRDGALRTAGLLSSKMGGPPVKPPQAEGISEVAYGNPKWEASGGEDRHRRSLYTFVKRTAPFALYTTFDAPTGEACIARRDVSNTPLQALSLLNDIIFLEAARALGQRLASLTTSDEERLQAAYYLILTRQARPEELNLLREFLATQRQRFSNGELDPKSFAGNNADTERAAWTAVARAVLNLDETITKG